MGLLSKAGGKSSVVLDEMGKALRDRLRGLPENTTPSTVLNLLKAYGAFQTGLCLSLENENYTSYATVGMGIEKLSFSWNKIWAGKKARDKFFRLETPAKLGIKDAGKDSAYWVFPLDSFKPWGTVMILGTQNSSDFNPETVSILLSDVIDKILMPVAPSDEA